MKPHLIPEIHAFTIKYNGLANRIITAVKLSLPFDINHEPTTLVLFETHALWDTGATSSMITANTAKQLNLIPTGTTKIAHAGGTSDTNTYVVTFILPNNVRVLGVQVSECPDTVGGFGAIIGMDLIAKGDFSITNAEKQTVMSFRYPSIQRIDYVAEVNRLKYHGTKRNAPCPCGKTYKDGKQVKFKDCHGKRLLI